MFEVTKIDTDRLDITMCGRLNAQGMIQTLIECVYRSKDFKN